MKLYQIKLIPHNNFDRVNVWYLVLSCMLNEISLLTVCLELKQINAIYSLILIIDQVKSSTIDKTVYSITYNFMQYC